MTIAKVAVRHRKYDFLVGSIIAHSLFLRRHYFIRRGPDYCNLELVVSSSYSRNWRVQNLKINGAL